MENLAPRWRKFLNNLGWYLGTLAVLVLLTSILRTFPIVLILWVVGLGWGVVLAYQLSRLLFGRDEAITSEEQLQSYMDQALAYKAQIDSAIKATPGKTRRTHLEQLAGQIESWTEAISDLVQRLNGLRQDELIRRDMKQVPQAIANLETRLANESDAAVRSQLERTLTNRKKQLAALEELQNTLKRAEIQIENTLSMLGTIYSQILTGQSTNDVANYNQLSTEVAEEVRLLQDHLEALREVRLGRG